MLVACAADPAAPRADDVQSDHQQLLSYYPPSPPRSEGSDVGRTLAEFDSDDELPN